MQLTQKFFRFAAPLICAATSMACSDDSDVVMGPAPIDPLFTSYVALGNSITAGFQSSGISDSTQQQSYALLLAQQLGTRYAYPSVLGSGCPAPAQAFGLPVDTADCQGRSPFSVTARLNNVAVPGAKVADLYSKQTSQSNALTMLFLGGKTQIERARDADPTFVSVWIGNNDILTAAINGMPGSATPVNTFAQQFDSVVTELKSIPTLRGGVLIGVVDVLNTPMFFPSINLSSPQFRASLEQVAGQAITVHNSCTVAGSGALVSFAVVPAIRAGLHPPSIRCDGVSDVFILTSAETQQLNTILSSYNNHIRETAEANNWVYWDPNPLLIELKAEGCINSVFTLSNPAVSPFGECISFDGVHPSGRAHIEIANGIIRAINAHYSTTMPAQ